MRWLSYNLCTRTNTGTLKNPQWQDVFNPVMIKFTPENESIAKAEAYNGEYIVMDDGRPEIVSVQEDIDNMLIDHELRLTMIELDI